MITDLPDKLYIIENFLMCTEYTARMEYSHVSEFVDAFGFVL